MSFSKSWNCTGRFGECNFNLFLNKKKIHKLLNNINMKNFAWRKCWKSFHEAIVLLEFEKNYFKVSVQNFCYRFTWYHWLRKLLIVFQQIIIRITMCNLHWESSNLFMYVIIITTIKGHSACLRDMAHWRSSVFWKRSGKMI